MHVCVKCGGTLVLALGRHEGTYAGIVERTSGVSRTPFLRRLDLPLFGGRDARSWLGCENVLAADDGLHCGSEVGFSHGRMVGRGVMVGRGLRPRRMAPATMFSRQNTSTTALASTTLS